MLLTACDLRTEGLSYQNLNLAPRRPLIALTGKPSPLINCTPSSITWNLGVSFPKRRPVGKIKWVKKVFDNVTFRLEFE